MVTSVEENFLLYTYEQKHQYKLLKYFQWNNIWPI